MKFIDRSHVTSSNQRFFKFKILKNQKVHVGLENDWSGTVAALSYSMDEIIKMYGGVFPYSNPLGSYEQF